MCSIGDATFSLAAFFLWLKALTGIGVDTDSKSKEQLTEFYRGVVN